MRTIASYRDISRVRRRVNPNGLSLEERRKNGRRKAYNLKRRKTMGGQGG